MKTVKSLFILFLVVGCGKSPAKKTYEQGPLEFKPTTQDATIDIQTLKNMNSENLLKKDSLLFRSTAEILEFSETLFDLSFVQNDAKEKQRYTRLGEKFRSAFYQNKTNTTQFDNTSSTYLELALGLAYEGPESLKSMIGSELDKQQSKLGRALGLLKLEMKPQETEIVDVSLTIGEFESFFRSIPSFLHKEGVESKIVQGVGDQLNKQYVPLLTIAKYGLKILSVQHSPEFNISVLEKAVQGFSVLPPALIQPLLREFAPAKELAEKMKSTKNVHQLFDLFLELWTHPMVDKNAFKSQSQELFDFLNDLSSEELIWLKAYNKRMIEYEELKWWEKIYTNAELGIHELKTPIRSVRIIPKMNMIKMYIDNFMSVEEVVKSLQVSLNKALFREFDSQLRQFAPMLVATVSQTIAKSVGDSFGDIKQNLKTILRTEGQRELKGRLFSEKSEFIAIEDAFVQMKYGANGRLSTQKNHSTSDLLKPFRSKITSGAVVSSGETLGLALSLQAKRLFAMDSNIDTSSKRYYEEVFTVVNKMMAIGGFSYMESEKPRFSGLFRMITGPGAQHDMDMFNYDLEKAYFSVPENIVVNKAYAVNTDITRRIGHRANVAGNAEISRGAANMMKYFQDWKENGFDKSMGRETYQAVKIFPKEAFYALSIGVGSVPLRNLTREGLVGYTKSGKQKEAHEFEEATDGSFDENGCAIPNSDDPVVAAALTSVSVQGRGEKVKSSELARFILAADTFLQAVDGAEASKAGPLQAVVDGEKKTLKAIVCGRKSIRLLVMGLANFLVSRMQDADGGFVSEFSLKDNIKLTSEKRLEDQLLVIQALTSVYKHWRGKAYTNLAVDAYFFMNRALYNPELGFYRSSDVDGSKNVDLRLLAMTLETLNEIAPYVPIESREQLAALTQAWSKELISLEPKIQ